MLRRLLTPRWLGALLLAVLYGWGAYHLGWWQYNRHLAKVERNDRMDRHITQAPVPLASVLTDAGFDPDAEWTHVTVSGSYDPQPQVAVRGRATDTAGGFEVLALLTTVDGDRLVVDRGFVAYGDDGPQTIPPLTAPPSGPVTVTGWLRAGEESHNDPGPGRQIATLSLSETAHLYGAPSVLPAYVLLDTETLPDGSSPPRPDRLSAPDRSLGPHQAYAFQWWFSMPVGVVLLWLGIRRELRAEDPTYATRPKKQRIWDDEDE